MLCFSSPSSCLTLEALKSHWCLTASLHGKRQFISDWLTRLAPQLSLLSSLQILEIPLSCCSFLYTAPHAKLNLVWFHWAGAGWEQHSHCAYLRTVTLSVTCVPACPSHEPKQSALKTRAASHLRFHHWACLQRAQLFLGSSIPIPPWCVDSTLSTHAI